MYEVARCWSFALLVCVACATLSVDVAAQPRQYQVEPPSESFLPQYLRERMARRISARRDSTEITNLFRTVASAAGHSTAEVISNGKRVALATIVASDGFAITKASELNRVGSVFLRLSNDRMIPATLVNKNADYDIALLKLKADDLLPVRWHQRNPAVGSFLLSVGRGGDAIGLGITSVGPRKIEDRGLLGVKLSSGDAGVRVAYVAPGTGAYEAGIVAGDIITSVNGEKIATHAKVTERLRKLYPGDIVNLGIQRGQDQIEIACDIREYALLKESEDESRVNGPRNARLTGFSVALQHDTVLGPDQCGGPIVDTSGNVVGINIARAGRVCSYAIPAPAIRPVVNDLLNAARQSR